MRNYDQLANFASLTKFWYSDSFSRFVNICEKYALNHKDKFQEIIDELEEALDGLPIIKSSRNVEELNQKITSFLAYVDEQFQFRPDYILADAFERVIEKYVLVKIQEYTGTKRIALYFVLCFYYIVSLECAYEEDLEWSYRHTGLIEPFKDVEPLIVAVRLPR
jgi:hypothetical protein